jgi:hypothetical protein
MRFSTNPLMWIVYLIVIIFALWLIIKVILPLMGIGTDGTEDGLSYLSAAVLRR